jgi:hypothetical protein
MANDLKFIQVGDLAKGITEHTLPDSDDLAGQTLVLNCDDGTALRIQFKTTHELNWAVVEGAEKGLSGDSTYCATCPRKGIYFVDYLRQDLRATSMSLVVDLEKKIATVVIGRLPTEEQTRQDAFSRATEGLELTSVSARFLSAAVDRPLDVQIHPHQPTDELVGKRVQYVYSRSEVYEHVYLNEKLYTWQCLEGVEKGLADTDRCHYYKVDEALYLFVWREKVVPTLGVVLIDLNRMKTTGKLFGYEQDDFDKLTNAPIGAYATLLNTTRYV